MSYNRLKFDSCAYQHKLNESIGPGEYMLDNTNICKPCFVPSPSINVQRFGASICPKNLIDIDSELIGITRKASECPGKQYLPSDKEVCNKVKLRECNQLDSENCRLSNPPCTLRCTGWLPPFQYLCINPQERVIIPFDTNISNRTLVKNAHRPCIPKPLDQTLALPPISKHKKPLFCGVEAERHPLHFRTCGELKHY
jgi:hypothetical protein